MPHRFELAPTGRAKCRGCKRSIAAGELRFGCSVPNAFGEGEALQWFHVVCGAERRGEAFLQALGAEGPQPEAGLLEDLRARAELGVSHPRWTRPCRLERAPSGRAKCRHCHELIAGGGLRVALEFVEEGMITPSGYVHPSCADAYLGSTAYLAERMRRSSDLGASDYEEFEQALRARP